MMIKPSPNPAHTGGCAGLVGVSVVMFLTHNVKAPGMLEALLLQVWVRVTHTFYEKENMP